MSEKKITDIDLFKQLIVERRPVKEIAGIFDTTSTTVRTTAKKLGIKLSNREEVRKKLHENFEFIKEQYEVVGMPFKQIAKDIGIPTEVLRRYYYTYIFGSAEKPSVDFESHKEFIRHERRNGMSIREIADRINADYYELEEYCRKNNIRNEFNLKSYISEEVPDDENLTYAEHNIKTHKMKVKVKIGSEIIEKEYIDITEYFMGDF